MAASVIAYALADMFASEEKAPTVLYMGGVHFEDTITKKSHKSHPVSLTHILPSRWLENEMYMGEDARDYLMKCIDSIHASIDGIVIHEKLKREIKDHVEIIAEILSIPVIKRKSLNLQESTMLYQ